MKVNLKESKEFTLYGTLDGMTVAELRKMLDEYPEDAYLDVQFDPAGDYFVFKWEE